MNRAAEFIVRIFFRRTAITGAEHVPRSGPLLFVLNHPNALIDPLFLLAFSPRPVAFLAKAPLFRMPVIGWLVRGAGSIPVYRRQDAADMSQNRATFEQVHASLARGGAIALFPEGTSHSEPQMRRFKTGAARMALGAASLASDAVSVVPAGLYYTAKGRFRSSALLCFGPPIAVVPAPLDGNNEPDSDTVHDLTAKLEASLAAVVLQADHDEALRLVTRAERIFTSAIAAAPSQPDLADQFGLRRRFLQGYAMLRRDAPAELAALERRVVRYDAELVEACLAPESLPAVPLAAPSIVGNVVREVGWLALIAPLGVAGIVLHWPAYQIIGPFVTRGIRVERDVIATGKVLAAAILFPLTWIVVAAFIGTRFGIVAGVVALLGAPLSGYAALRFLEQLDRSAGAARGLLLRLARPAAYRRLAREREEIRAAIVALADRVDAPDLQGT
ncbi:MAG TPA: lysophospholipid acyltransferase family protein [Gemmatimonadales bacterium]|jgi:1-acyl-sn-glycerol-3-phosphate acyltransferase